MTTAVRSSPRPIRTPMELFRRRVSLWAARLRSQPREVRVLVMRHKWASCSARGRISFSQDLLTRTSIEQDYVIVHELLHLRHPNHGRVFRALLTAALPPRTRRLAGRLLAENAPFTRLSSQTGSSP
jgi:predicted metal-dependent hydrolase